MIKINEEFKNLIPQLSAEEFNQLEENILADGCRDPIVLWGDILIDGHNRLKICEEHGYPYKTITKNFSDSDSVKLWIIQNQFGRRNLTDFQRAELALEYKKILDKNKKINQEKKNSWIENARKSFDAGERKPCSICDKYESVTHAHHIYPLHCQFDDGITDPINDHVWLCPTHHSAVHLIIDKFDKSLRNWSRYPSLDGFDLIEKAKINQLATGFLEVAYISNIVAKREI